MSSLVELGKICKSYDRPQLTRDLAAAVAPGVHGWFAAKEGSKARAVGLETAGGLAGMAASSAVKRAYGRRVASKIDQLGHIPKGTLTRAFAVGAPLSVLPSVAGGVVGMRIAQKRGYLKPLKRDNSN